jgi:hypothetical protein
MPTTICTRVSPHDLVEVCQRLPCGEFGAVLGIVARAPYGGSPWPEELKHAQPAPHRGRFNKPQVGSIDPGFSRAGGNGGIQALPSRLGE